MTVSSQVRSVSYAGDGVTAIFPVPFYFLENGHLTVTKVASDGTEDDLTLNVDYTVSGAGNPAGGSVTVPDEPIVGETLLIQRIVPITQETDYVENDPFPAESHERALDKLTMIAQQVSGSIRNALRVPDYEGEPGRVPPIPERANKWLAFDENGDPVVTLPSPESALQLRVDLANSDDPTLGAGMVGFQRSGIVETMDTVGAMLSSQEVSLWEYAYLVTNKPTPNNPSTWDWTPAMQQFVNVCAGFGLAGKIPSGRYLFNQITLPDGKLFIRGAGMTTTFLGPFSANQTLFYKDQASPSGVDNITNQVRAFTDLCFNDEADMGGCRAVFCQGVTGFVLQRIMFRKLVKAVEFNRCFNIVIDTFLYFKGGRFIFDASPYRKIAPSTYDYTKTVQITNGQDLLGYSDLGGSAWFSFRDTVNVLMANVQSPALMGTAEGVRIQGSCEGIWLNNVILVWPTTGINMRAGLIDVGSGTPDTLVDPEYSNFVAVAVDQPSLDAFFMEGDYWNMESCLAANGEARGTTGMGIKVTARSRYFNIAKTLVRDMPGNGIEINNGAVDGIIRDCDVFNNASTSGSQISAVLTRPNGVVFRDMRVVGTVTVSGGRLVGGSTSPVIHRDTGSASTPASTAATDLFTYTIPAGTLKVGQKVKLLAYGTFAANANNKTLRLFFGAANMGGWSAATSGGAWRMDADIELTAAGAQEYIRRTDVQNANNNILTGTGTDDETLALIVKIQGENGTASAGDIVCQHFSVEVVP